MNALFENFNLNHSSNTSEIFAKPHSKDFYPNKTINSNQNITEKNPNKINTYLISDENLNKIAQSLNELNFKYFKERQAKIDLNISAKNFTKEKKNKDSHECEKNEKKNKYAFDSLSEVKKFKTELCHSWELTGTCKYGLNVSYFFLIFYFDYSVFLLMEKMI